MLGRLNWEAGHSLVCINSMLQWNSWKGKGCIKCQQLQCVDAQKQKDSLLLSTAPPPSPFQHSCGCQRHRNKPLEFLLYISRQKKKNGQQKHLSGDGCEHVEGQMLHPVYNVSQRTWCKIMRRCRWKWKCDQAVAVVQPPATVKAEFSTFQVFVKSPTGAD